MTIDVFMIALLWRFTVYSSNFSSSVDNRKWVKTIVAKSFRLCQDTCQAPTTHHQRHKKWWLPSVFEIFIPPNVFVQRVIGHSPKKLSTSWPSMCPKNSNCFVLTAWHLCEITKNKRAFEQSRVAPIVSVVMFTSVYYEIILLSLHRLCIRAMAFQFIDRAHAASGLFSVLLSNCLRWLERVHRVFFWSVYG